MKCSSSCGIVFAVGPVGHDHNFVGRFISEELAFTLLEHADDLVESASDLDGLAQRVFSRNRPSARS